MIRFHHLFLVLLLPFLFASCKIHPVTTGWEYETPQEWLYGKYRSEAPDTPASLRLKKGNRLVFHSDTLHASGTWYYLSDTLWCNLKYTNKKPGISHYYKVQHEDYTRVVLHGYPTFYTTRRRI